MYGVACYGPWPQKIQEVERAFGRKDVGLISVQQLLSFDKSRKKAFSSLMAFLKRIVPTTKTMYIKVRGRKHIVKEYMWGGKPSCWTVEVWQQVSCLMFLLVVVMLILVQPVVYGLLLFVLLGVVVQTGWPYYCFSFPIGVGSTHPPAVSWNPYVGLFDYKKKI